MPVDSDSFQHAEMAEREGGKEDGRGEDEEERTHIARRKRRVHGASRVGLRRQPAGVVERRGLAVVDRGAELHALVVAAADELAGGGDEGGADLVGFVSCLSMVV